MRHKALTDELLESEGVVDNFIAESTCTEEDVTLRLVYEGLDCL